MVLVSDTKNKIDGQGGRKKERKKERSTTKIQTPHLSIRQRAVTYLGLFQTPEGFKQIPQVTAHTI